ncbi:MAG: hypothetical protein WKF66_02175 [Pedobacter sp.]
MNEEEIKDKILEQFSKMRRNPNGYYTESHFLDYLTYPEHRKDSLKNSFKGVKAYYDFMYRLELEFVICFTLSDLDKYYSVEGLTKKVAERISKGRGNLMIINQRNQKTDNYYIEVGLFALLAVLYFWLGLHLVTFLTTIAFVIAIHWILRSKIRSQIHNKKLTKKLISGKKIF